MNSTRPNDLTVLQNQILAMALTGPITTARVEFATFGRWFSSEIETAIAAMRKAELIK